MSAWIAVPLMFVFLLLWARFEWRLGDRNLHSSSELWERQRRARQEWEK